MVTNADYLEGCRHLDDGGDIEAIEYFKKASAAGCKEASYQVGIMILDDAINASEHDLLDFYAEGTNEGYIYLAKAFRQGCSIAKKTMVGYFESGVYENGTKEAVRKIIDID